MELYIIAGPNGVGKTTFAHEFLPKYTDCTNFVNADLIARAIAPFSPDAAAFRAGNDARRDALVCQETRALCF
jgi:predicted ABC-type ATPase